MSKHLNMKQLLIIYLVCIVMGCGTQQSETPENVVKINAETYIRDKLNDPNTYEFVSLEVVDSVTYRDNIDYRRDYLYANERAVKVIDSLSATLGDQVNDVASYTYLFTFRATNAMGAKVLNEYLVQTGPKPELEVINFTDDMDELFLNPGDFPGYREAIQKVLQ